MVSQMLARVKTTLCGFRVESTPQNTTAERGCPKLSLASQAALKAAGAAVVDNWGSDKANWERL
jgi:hypothetical protein